MNEEGYKHRRGRSNPFRSGRFVPVPFKYVNRGSAAYCDAVIIDGETVPLYKWRYNVKVTGLKVNCEQKLGKLSTLRTSHFAGRDKTLKQVLYTELDIAEFTLDGKVVYVIGFGDERAANFIVKMDNGTICSLELAVTMPEGSKERIKRSVFSTNGMSSTVSFGEMPTVGIEYHYNTIAAMNAAYESIATGKPEKVQNKYFEK